MDQLLSWLTWAWNAIPNASTYIKALGGILAFVLVARTWGEKSLIWVLQRIFGNKGGLRLVQARGKGFWRARQNDETMAELQSRWYATSLLTNQTIRILTVRMKRPAVDGGLSAEMDDPLSDPPYNTVGVKPGPTVEFNANFHLPVKHLKKGKDFKCELVFTDSFNNRHHKKVVFEHRPPRD